jgi:nucleoside-diphosphate-sugar epimerase
MSIALVTGADGFIGSRLVELLVKKGYKIKALSQYNSFNNWGWIEDIECKDKVEVLTGDIRDPHYCKWVKITLEALF